MPQWMSERPPKRTILRFFADLAEVQAGSESAFRVVYHYPGREVNDKPSKPTAIQCRDPRRELVVIHVVPRLEE